MSTATIKRGNGRKSGARQRRPVRRKSIVNRIIAWLPLTPEQVHRLLTIGLGLLAVMLLYLLAQFLGLPAMLRAEMSDMAGRAGLRVEKVEVTGAHHMEEAPVYTMALDETHRSMFDLDLAGVRTRIKTLGWVQDARISRRLPDTLVVNIVERTPVAIWQHDNQLSLVDTTGTVLTGVDARTMPDLPLIVGPDANKQTQALTRLMEAAPALKPMLASATWVGHRRWDLHFQSGETLALPEGTGQAAAALVNFARMDGVDRLLGRGIIRFDMRDPARFVVRLPPGQGEDRNLAMTSDAAKAAVQGLSPAAGED